MDASWIHQDRRKYVMDDNKILQRMALSMSTQDLQLGKARPESLALNAEPISNVNYSNFELVSDILTDLEVVNGMSKEGAEDYTADMKELIRILSDPNFQALIEAHDLVCNRNYEPVFILPPNEAPAVVPNGLRQTGSTFLSRDCPPEDEIRQVGVRRGPNADLGMTVRSEDGKLIISRILIGSLVHKQGLLHVGDIITEVNGKPVTTPQALQVAVRATPDTVNLKIVPAWFDSTSTLPTYMKAFFYYDAQYDRSLPSKSIGLTFAKGDILEVINMEDDNYWQARKLGDEGPARLIPSRSLQEQRHIRAIPMENGIVIGEDSKSCSYSICKRKEICKRKDKQIVYGNEQLLDIDRHELILYEEVLHVPAFSRKCLILLGPSGSARRNLVSRILKSDPVQYRYGYPVPHTSRPPRPGEVHGRQYFYAPMEQMKADIMANQYVEHGEYGGNLYGTKTQTVRSIIQSGKTCVLDCSPQCLKILRTREFLPYVVFVAVANFKSLNKQSAANSRPPERSCTMETMKTAEEADVRPKEAEESNLLLSVYEPFVDLILHEDEAEVAFATLLHSLYKVESGDSWIPASWIY